MQEAGGVLTTIPLHSTGNPVGLSDSDIAQRPWEHGASLVEFWSFRCEACRLVGVVSSELAQKHAGTLTVYKVNVDSNPRLSSLLGVTVLPSAAIFRDGRFVGWLRNRWTVQDVLAFLQC